ncbi:MAG: nitrite reductase (NAD(P)H) small subunit [Propioniciclava sp.]
MTTASLVATRVCRLADLPVERGVAALVAGPGQPVQVALVRAADGTVHCVGHRDPYTAANVIGRGLVGTRTVEGDLVPTIASPLHKQLFDLRTGAALDDPSVSLGAWHVEVVDGEVLVGAMIHPAADPLAA